MPRGIAASVTVVANVSLDDDVDGVWIELKLVLQHHSELVRKLIPEVLVSSVHGDGCTSIATPLMALHFHGWIGDPPLTFKLDRQIREKANDVMPLIDPASLMSWP
ncbi:hypothetical protein GUJ93_ZPchr0012g20559 [Zizania palustris]|uniref:Uncharacterized protein n=1 Tax=Zizania palustris TaxID=103762 RepID=A0A8J5WQ68_ZIZPA|nr:hypothetical protein GUJ93_ZPchr0012g20559 [Zizania palustris]